MAQPVGRNRGAWTGDDDLGGEASHFGLRGLHGARRRSREEEKLHAKRNFTFSIKPSEQGKGSAITNHQSHLQNYPQTRLLRHFAPLDDNKKVVLSLRAESRPLIFWTFAYG